MSSSTKKQWKKLKPIEEGVSSGCLCCGMKASLLPMDRILAVGFGGVTVRKGEKIIWSGDDTEKTIAEFEVMAQADPDHDWRVNFLAPLWEGTWQRHEKETWVLVEKGLGFA